MTAADDDIPLTDEELALAERGSALVAAAMTDPAARAPLALRASLERGGLGGRGSLRRRGRSPRRLMAPGLAAVCLLGLALVAALGGPQRGAASPSVADVAAVTRLPARHAAPAAAGGARPRLAAAVGGLAFPDWRRAFGWKTTGLRADRIGGRAVTTVFYRYSSRRTLGYAIVAGAPLRPAAPATGRVVMRGGARYRVVTRSGRTTVTWTQAGHTCVIDAPAAVPAGTLVTLAAWANA